MFLKVNLLFLTLLFFFFTFYFSQKNNDLSKINFEKKVTSEAILAEPKEKQQNEQFSNCFPFQREKHLDFSLSEKRGTKDFHKSSSSLLSSPIITEKDCFPLEDMKIRVIAISLKEQTVLLDIGSNFGLKRNTCFFIYQEHSPIAKVKVISITSNMSCAKIISEPRFQNEQIQVGDRAILISPFWDSYHLK